MKIKTVFINSLYLFMSHVMVRLITAVATILVARYLSATEYGLLSLAISFTIVTAFFTELGFTHTLIREGTKPDADIGKLLGSYMSARSIIGVITFLTSIVIIQLFYPAAQRGILYWAVVPSIIGSVFTGYGVAYFQVTQQMKFTALIRTLTGILTAIALVVCIVTNASLLFFSAIYGFSIIFGGALSFYFACRKIRFRLNWDRQLLNGVWSFTITGFVVMIFPQMGPIVLERTTNLTQVGYFAAAYRIPSILYQVPNVLALAFYPMLFKLANSMNTKAQEDLNIIQIRFMSAIGIFISIPFIFYPKWWINLLLGPTWLQAASILSMLSYLVIFQSISSPVSDGLATAGYYRRRSIFQVSNFFLAIYLFVVLGKSYGANGAAIAALIAESVNLLGLTSIKPNGWSILIKGVKHSLPSFIVIYLIGVLISSTALQPLIAIFILSLLFIVLLSVVDSDIRIFLEKYLKFFLTKKNRMKQSINMEDQQ